MLMNADQSCLLIVDVQENLAPVMVDPRGVINRGAFLLRVANRLGVPVVVSEQYPKGLGPTMVDLRQEAPEGSIIEKIHFSCAAEPDVRTRIDGLRRRQIVMAGIEAHVCVLQSALGFKAAGYEVFVAADACSSRKQASAEAAFQRMRVNGIETVTSEMVAFEWMARAGTPEFKDLIRWIK